MAASTHPPAFGLLAGAGTFAAFASVYAGTRRDPDLPTDRYRSVGLTDRYSGRFAGFSVGLTDRYSGRFVGLHRPKNQTNRPIQKRTDRFPQETTNGFFNLFLLAVKSSRISVCVYVFSVIHIRICMCIYIYIYMYVYVYVYVCVYMCIYIYIYTYTYRTRRARVWPRLASWSSSLI